MKIGNVLSLFDGMSCCQLALHRAGIAFDKYYASEIDKYAIQVTQANFPNTIQLGDVKAVKVYDLPKIDLLTFGSPCQGFSFAGKGLNFNDPRSALFFEAVRILKELREKNPSIIFLCENVRMKKEHELVISNTLGVAPVEINSALVSAQNRVRLYWTNIAQQPQGLFGDMQCMITQPKDRGILLKDILETEVHEKYYISDTALKRILRKTHSNPQFNPDKTGSINPKNNSGQLSSDKGTTLITDRGTGRNLEMYETDKVPALAARNGCSHDNRIVQGVLNDSGELRECAKSNALDAHYFKGMDNHSQRTMVKQSQENRLHDVDGKAITICYGNGGNTATGLYKVIVHNMSPRSGDPKKGGTGPLSREDGKTYAIDTSKQMCIEKREIHQLNPNKESGGGMGILTKERIRRLTPTECERLQGVPDGYTALVSDTQRYKMLGNGWNIDTIVHIFSFW